MCLCFGAGPGACTGVLARAYWDPHDYARAQRALRVVLGEGQPCDACVAPTGGGLSILRPCPLGWGVGCQRRELPAVLAAIGDGWVAAVSCSRIMLVCMRDRGCWSAFLCVSVPCRLVARGMWDLGSWLAVLWACAWSLSGAVCCLGLGYRSVPVVVGSRRESAFLLPVSVITCGGTYPFNFVQFCNTGHEQGNRAPGSQLTRAHTRACDGSALITAVFLQVYPMRATCGRKYS